MSDLNISNRYAHALMNLATEKNFLEKVSEDIDLISKTFSASKELQLMLINPIIKPETKLSVLAEIFKSKVNSDTFEFLEFVIHKDREILLFKIIKQFLVLRDKKFGILNAKIISSTELLDDQKMNLQKKLEDYTKKTVRLSFAINPKLIGGFIVKMDDTIMDASLRHQLDLLKEKFLQGNVSMN
ncbi:MAG: ATP synthase F1 subunit delta [Ignavibacteriales bacterium]|nr:ATP synthase F1 subunit delta [Ignavibacteriales bacterium]